LLIWHGFRHLGASPISHACAQVWHYFFQVMDPFLNFGIFSQTHEFVSESGSRGKKNNAKLERMRVKLGTRQDAETRAKLTKEREETTKLIKKNYRGTS